MNDFLSGPENKKRRLILTATTGIVAFFAVGLWWSASRHHATPDVVEGWAAPDPAGKAIRLFDSDDHRAGNGYIIAGASWAGPDNAWHDGADGPTCVGTDTATRIHVRLGIVDVEPDREGVGGPRVVWLRCLG